MPCSLPPEILDLIVDFLHDEPAALKACCLVSRSLVPRTRTHLFAHVEFSSPKSHIQLWAKAFRDPSNSPAHYTRSLSILGFPVVAAPDTGMDGWIRTFSGVVRLHVDTLGSDDGTGVSLVPLRGLSPTLKSLRMAYRASTPPSEVFGLVCSFPLLEDLTLVFLDNDSEVDGWSVPLTSPKLTGSLDLRMLGGIRSAIRRLLDFPNGLHFTKISVSCLSQDVSSMMDLVSRCSDTLESLGISYYLTVLYSTPSLDLSKLKKLKEVAFGYRGLNVQWITATLQTVESTNLQQITIHSPSTFKTPNESVYREWQDLDRLLLRFWTSRSIRPKIGYKKTRGGRGLRDLIPRLLPELTGRGIVDLVESD